jgi:hypothetical protein
MALKMLDSTPEKLGFVTLQCLGYGSLVLVSSLLLPPGKT